MSLQDAKLTTCKKLTTNHRHSLLNYSICRNPPSFHYATSQFMLFTCIVYYLMNNIRLAHLCHTKLFLSSVLHCVLKVPVNESKFPRRQKPKKQESVASTANEEEEAPQEDNTPEGTDKTATLSRSDTRGNITSSRRSPSKAWLFRISLSSNDTYSISGNYFVVGLLLIQTAV